MNNKKISMFSIVLLMLATFSSSVFAQSAADLERVITPYVPDRFMGSVLIARGDEVIFNKSYGSANLEWNIPNDSQTKFRLGSLTKQFTAAAILLLEEQGKLKTDDLVSVYMDDVPPAWSDITLKHLLTHTAGLPNFTSMPAYVPSMPMPSPVEQTVAIFKDLPLDFAPGSQFRYSNSGYVLLGYLIGKISGVSYEQFLRENIFMPLGMNDSGYDSHQKLLPKRANGYSPGPGGPVNALYIDMTIPHGAGALYSTAEDLLLWNRSLFGGKLLSAASLEKMTTPNLGDYAFGLTVTTENAVKKISHNGAINGFNTSLAYYPAEELSIIVLSNMNGPGADTIAANLGNVLHGGTVVLPEDRQEVSVSETILQKYVGSYQFAPNVFMVITLENGQLMTQLGPQPKLPIFAESETRFFPKLVDAVLNFELDTGGAVTAVVLRQNGRETRAPRQAQGAVPAAQTELQLSEEVLQRYVGSYQLAPNFIITISLAGGQLMAQATGQPAAPVFAETQTRFFYKVVNAQLDFDVDAAGAVTGLVLHQNGRDMPAPRQ